MIYRQADKSGHKLQDQVCVHRRPT